jgi:hypothetical protein
MPTAPRVEKNKKQGVSYASTSDGLELPVIDITHPAFTVGINPEEQQERVAACLREQVSFEKMPRPLRSLLLRFLLRNSILAKGIRNSRGTFMTGLNTYLLKLGPEMLGDAYAAPIDRKIALSLPALSMRLRLQDVAHLMAETLAPLLLAEPGRALQFINVAGGPAIDSLNALILLRKKWPAALDGREIAIRVLDLDQQGPSFGEAALAALVSSGGPLHGLRVKSVHVVYNWSQPEQLKSLLATAADDIAIASSEGGLFEYGADEDIIGNLIELRRFGIRAVIGSVTRNDEAIHRANRLSAVSTIKRGLPVFRQLIASTGWSVAQVVERPFSDQVVLA